MQCVISTKIVWDYYKTIQNAQFTKYTLWWMQKRQHKLDAQLKNV